jgi:hypothetical protein
VRQALRATTLIVTISMLLWLVCVGFLLQPSNQRDWEFGMERLPQLTIHGGTVRVQGLRDFRYTPSGTHSSNYVDRVFEADRIERVWFVKEPFTIAPFTRFKGVAHTYFVFDFQDQPPLVISVEARREKGETYDAVRGLLNQYELIYIWGTEHDQTGRRAVLEQNRLYMYPLTIPAESARALFLQLAEASQQLETRPRFYHTLTSNCTNELAKAANQVKPGAIPPNRALLFPGHSDEVLHRLGFIPNDLPLESVSQAYYISDLVLANYGHEDFSRLLRLELMRREGPDRPSEQARTEETSTDE